ncbi:peptide chain release factor H [Aquimarina algicola]|uniref:Peptide chain release factor H n=1 Tax=Aquimarina algicola TaxID=2589995 RepID=A0A504J8N3_9FLAO|nr:peptide chain release factor H [Aquimarina algicola]TPN86944.1 peptide chain release factor H [Aquimarina algicola]
MKQKIIQITAGRGPAECCWVAAKVLKYFLEELKQASISYTVIDKVNGIENGTVQSVTIQLKGKEIDKVLNSWIGTIQWIGTSTFRKHHKRKNWFVGCYALDTIDIQPIEKKDIVFQTMRSSGPGGQHVNKVSSAVRAIHQPTKTNVVVMDSRSQHQNKKNAIVRLTEKVQHVQLEQLKKSLVDQWENHLSVQRGNPTRVFRGTNFKKEKKVKTFKKQRNELKQNLRNQLNS